MKESLSRDALQADRPAPRYATIERQFAKVIELGLLPAGTVVTEDPIARLFGTSRTPVRTAFNELERRGLIERFDGRGFIVCGAKTPKRLALTHAMLGLNETPATAPQPITSERIARDFEAAVAQALPFGLYRINEQAAGDHYGVSRTVIRELLSKFKDRGLVRKDLKSHWVVGPLTARDVGHYYAIRGQLEPMALIESAPHMPTEEFALMLARAKEVTAHGASFLPEQLRRLETDMHVTLQSRAPNPHLLRMVHQSQIALTVNQVFAETVGTRPFTASIVEHTIVLEFLVRGSWDAAGMALREHLRLSADRTRRRLMSISVFPEPDLPVYLRGRPT